MSSSLGWLPRFSLQRRCCRRHNTPGNQTHPADRAAPTNTLSLSETRVVSSCGSGGSDHHSPSLPRPQAASPDTPVTTGDDQLSIQLPEVMPCLSSYPLVLLSSAFGHLRGQHSFVMEMTEKPVMTSQARVNKPQVTLKRNRWPTIQESIQHRILGKEKQTNQPLKPHTLKQKYFFWRGKTPYGRRQRFRGGG